MAEKSKKTKAAALAAIGGTCAFVGIVLGGPTFGIPAIILGVKALKSIAISNFINNKVFYESK